MGCGILLSGRRHTDANHHGSGLLRKASGLSPELGKHWLAPQGLIQSKLQAIERTLSRGFSSGTSPASAGIPVVSVSLLFSEVPYTNWRRGSELDAPHSVEPDITPVIPRYWFLGSPEPRSPAWWLVSDKYTLEGERLSMK